MTGEFKLIVDSSKYVKIDCTKLKIFSTDLGKINYIYQSEEINLDLNKKEWIILTFIIEVMNFNFCKKPKRKIEYKGDLISGPNTLFYATLMQVEENVQ